MKFENHSLLVLCWNKSTKHEDLIEVYESNIDLVEESHVTFSEPQSWSLLLQELLTAPKSYSCGISGSTSL